MKKLLNTYSNNFLALFVRCLSSTRILFLFLIYFFTFIQIIFSIQDTLAQNNKINNKSQYIYEIKNNISKIKELEEIRKWSEYANVKVYLFGGSAAAYAFFVKNNFDLLSNNNQNSNLSVTDFLDLNQDLDIVVDGSIEQVKNLQKYLDDHFPVFQFNKSAWEVRPLRESMETKEKLLYNSNILNQHTDTLSNGFIEISGNNANEREIKYLFNFDDTQSRHNKFIDDSWNKKSTFLKNSNHEFSDRAKNKSNPPIFSVIRYLSKIFQYGLDIDTKSQNSIKEIIKNFEPITDLPNNYGQTWMQFNGVKLFQNCQEINFCYQTLTKLNLIDKLKTLPIPEKLKETKNIPQKYVNDFANLHPLKEIQKDPFPFFKIKCPKGDTLEEIVTQNKIRNTNEDPNKLNLSCEVSDLYLFQSMIKNRSKKVNILLPPEKDSFTCDIENEDTAVIENNILKLRAKISISLKACNNIDFKLIQNNSKWKIELLNRNVLKVESNKLLINQKLSETTSSIDISSLSHIDAATENRIRKLINYFGQFSHLKNDEINNDLKCPKANNLQTLTLPSPSIEDLGNYLIAVHATDFFPKNCKISVVDSDKRVEKTFFSATTHFALNQLAPTHSLGTWDNKKIAILTPLKDLFPQLLSLNFIDSFILGDFQLTKSSHVILSKNIKSKYSKEIEKCEKRGITFHYFTEEDNNLRNSIKNLVSGLGGIKVENEKLKGLPGEVGNITYLDKSINDMTFFKNILENYPDLSFGNPYYSLTEGKSDWIKTIDIGTLDVYHKSYGDHFGYYKVPAYFLYLTKFLSSNIKSAIPKHMTNEAKLILQKHLEYLEKNLNQFDSFKSQYNISINSDYNMAKISKFLKYSDLLNFLDKEADVKKLIFNENVFKSFQLFNRILNQDINVSLKENLFNLLNRELESINNNQLLLQTVGTIISPFYLNTNILEYQMILNMILKMPVILKFNLSFNSKNISNYIQFLYTSKALFPLDDIDKKNEMNNTPIIEAIVKERNENLALTYLNIGANINDLKANFENFKEISLLSLALLFNMKNLALKVLQTSHYTDYKSSDFYGNTPLDDAIISNNEEIALKLMKEKNIDKGGAMNYLGYEKFKGQTIEVVLQKKLYSLLPFFSKDQLNKVDSYNNPPLVNAIMNNDEQGAIRLVQAGAELNNVFANYQGYENSSILSIAISKKMDNLVKEILNSSQFTNFNHLNNYGNSALDDAILNLNYNLILNLVANFKVKYNGRFNFNGEEKYRDNIIKYILNNKNLHFLIPYLPLDQLNKLDEFNNAPIIDAILYYNDENLALSLLNSGIKIKDIRANYQGYIGETVLEIAKKKNMNRLLDKLLTN